MNQKRKARFKIKEDVGMLADLPFKLKTRLS